MPTRRPAAARVLAAALLALSALGNAPARADEAQATAALRAAFAQLPDAAFHRNDAEQAWFVDMQPIAQASGEARTEAVRRMVLGSSLPPLDALRMVGPDAWAAAGAPPLSDIRHVAGFGQPPIPVTVWTMRDAAAAAAVLDGLEDGDFEPVPGRAGMLSNGAPMEVNLTRRQPASPWRGLLGRSYFVAANGAAIIQAPGPEPVAALLDLGEPARLTSNVLVTAALDGLDTAAAGAEIRQAMLVSPTIGTGGLDPAAMLGAGGDMDTLRAKLEAAQAKAARGVPPFFSGLVADVQTGPHPGMAVSLVYADCATAEQAAARLAEAWTEAFATITPGTAKVATAPSGTLCAAAVTITAQDASGNSNPLFLRVYDGHVSRQANIFQIASTAN
ncbi:hypothetical protein [Zavarzinia sp. CC-PAN008]|uniref:hypothetical protein n=1 Tax=Zavarzinia sp. CC-PAN008 TaxID=3243332 RepID=UPI003F7497F0